jgi:hypothetical protein
MDVTKLNIFQWCKFLRHVGRTIMAAIVCAIIGLAGFASFESVLVPGMRSKTSGVQIGYVILASIYSGVVSYPSKNESICQYLLGYLKRLLFDAGMYGRMELSINNGY